jgi:hypothetical protein
MAKRIYYKDEDRESFEKLDWVKDNMNDYLKNKKVVSVETLKKVIRFWYIIE